MLFAFFATWSSIWQTAFLPLYFNKVAHFSVSYSAFMTIPVLTSGAFGKVILGGVSDRWKRNRLLLVISLVVISFYSIFFVTTNFDVDVFTALGMGFFSAADLPNTSVADCRYFWSCKSRHCARSYNVGTVARRHLFCDIFSCPFVARHR